MKARVRVHKNMTSSGLSRAAALVVVALLAGGCASSNPSTTSGSSPANVEPTTAVVPSLSATPTSTTTAVPSSSAPPPAAPVRPHTGGRWLMGFYPEYQRDLMPADEIDWTAMTHLAVARVVPRRDGTLNETFDYDETHGPALAKDLAARARQHGVTPILMVGGAGTHDDFAAAAAANPDRLAKSLLATMRTLGFAGLDLDWEPITDADQKPLAALVANLRQSDPGVALSLPGPWVTTTFPQVSPIFRQLAPQLDQINVMTYGMAGAWDGWKTWHGSALDGAGPGGPSSIAVNVKSYLDGGVPPQKLGLGVGFYGTCWSGGVSGPRQDVGSSKIVAEDNDMSYANIMADYFTPSAYHYDQAAQAPYLGFASPHGPKSCTFVSYENAESIAAKGAYARAHGLGGAIVWTINQAHLRNAPSGQRDALLKGARTAFGA